MPRLMPRIPRLPFSPAAPLGALAIAAGCLLATLLLTGAQAGSVPTELLTIGGITTVFLFGAGYGDIRSKAAAAHRRLDEKAEADKEAVTELKVTLERLRGEVQDLAIDLARAGVIPERRRRGAPGDQP